MKIHKLIGQTFGLLTVTEKDSVRTLSGRITWRCTCKCGNENYHVTTDHLVRKVGSVKSCGCSTYSERLCLEKSEIQAQRKNPTLTNHMGFPLGLYTQLIKKAHKNSRRAMKFEISIEQLWDLYIKQNKQCALTGLALHLTPRVQSNSSLDRIDSTKDYTLDNVQWVHKDVNIMKNMYSMEYFVWFCGLVAKQHNPDLTNAIIFSRKFGSNYKKI